MNVGQLKGSLAGIPDDTLVVLSRDSEGNRFSPLAEDSWDLYVAESAWSGDVVHPDDAAEYPEAVNVVVLWPNC